MDSAEYIAKQLGGASQHGDWWDTQCCVHRDNRASLGLTELKGKIEVKCQAGCNSRDIKEELKSRGFVLEQDKKKKRGIGEPVGEYDYRTASGELVMQVVRYQTEDGGKTFTQRHRDSVTNQWVNKGVGSSERVLYNLSAVARVAEQKGVVFIVEGEKDVHTLLRYTSELTPAIGANTATTNAGGAGKWEIQYTEALRGAKAIIVSDLDDAGRKHSAKVQKTLAMAGIDSRILELTSDRDIKDVTDFFERGNNIEQFIAQVKAVQTSTPAVNEILIFPGIHENTDDANALRLVAWHGRDLIYCNGLGWHEFDGKHFSASESKVQERAREVGRQIAREYVEANDELYKWGKSSQSYSKIKSMLEMAKSDSAISVNTEDLDKDLYSLNCLNGTLDLRTGKLKPHDPQDRITKLVDVDYDAEAKCPRFLQFLRESLADPDDTTEYLLKALGYTLTGVCDEQAIFFLKGPRGSGKGTLIRVLKALLGSFSKTIDPSVLASGADSAQTREQLSHLRGIRFVETSEVDAKHIFDASLIKRITGQDGISARVLYKGSIEYEPQFKIWVQTNEFPELPADDDAVWRRVHVVEFPYSKEGAHDNTLTAQLLKELPGVLALLVRYSQKWQVEGLKRSAQVVQSVADYRKEVDKLEQFIEHCCTSEAVRGAAVTGATELLSAYNAFNLKLAGGNRQSAEGQKTFSKRLIRRFGQPAKKNGISVYPLELKGEWS